MVQYAILWPAGPTSQDETDSGLSYQGRVSNGFIHEKNDIISGIAIADKDLFF